MVIKVIANDGFSGICTRCRTPHALGIGSSRKYCEQLMRQLSTEKTLEPQTSTQNLKEKYSTASLFGEARGKMFGVMECVTEQGSIKILKAFSGQYNNSWLIDGWCPPLFDVEEFELLTFATEKKIKNLGYQMEKCVPRSEPWLHLRKQRKTLSQNLMRDIHGLYQMYNFKGERLSLSSIFPKGMGIPTGTGDCCGPKMLNYAARQRLRPLGMSEFYWGKKNRSESKQHGLFYAPCADKCQPILGTMLCGLD